MSRLGQRLRKLRKKKSGGAAPIKGRMKTTARRGRQAPGTPRASRRPAAPAPRLSEMADAPQPQARSTATTAQDLADVGYGTGMTTPPALTQRVTPVAPYEEGYAFGQTPAPTPAPAPDPFQEPDPYQKGRDFGASWPVTTPSGPPIPGVSGPPEQAGPATTLDYDVWGEDPPAQAPLWNPGDPAPTFDPNQLGQMERDYEFGNITPATPGIDTPLPGAAPGQMTPDPGYLPPPPEMDQAELDKLSAQVRLRKILQNPALKRLLPRMFR